MIRLIWAWKVYASSPSFHYDSITLKAELAISSVLVGLWQKYPVLLFHLKAFPHRLWWKVFPQVVEILSIDVYFFVLYIYISYFTYIKYIYFLSYIYLYLPICSKRSIDSRDTPRHWDLDKGEDGKILFLLYILYFLHMFEYFI